LQQYPIDNKVLLAIEVVVMAILEGKRYEGYKKTGEVRHSLSCSSIFAPQGTQPQMGWLNTKAGQEFSLLQRFSTVAGSTRISAAPAADVAAATGQGCCRV
jgi:hypothetical protein